MITCCDNIFLATADPAHKEGFLRGYDAAFLSQVIDQLKSYLAETYDKYLFVIDSPVFESTYSQPSFNGKIPILFYLGDEKNLFNELQTKEYSAVFRQYMQGPPSSRVYPMPLSTTPLLNKNLLKESREKNINVFFSGCINANRIGLYSYFRFGKEFGNDYFLLSRFFSKILRQFGKKDLSSSFANSYIQFTSGFQKGLSQAAYAGKICDSRIVICPYGFISPETIRHYEALQAGCTVISRKWPFNELLASAPMVIVDKWQELETVLPSLLSDQDKLEVNHNKAIEWWESYCSPKGFASYVAERITKAEYH